MADAVAQALMNLDVKNMKLPGEGPRVIPVACNFAVNSSFKIDGSQLLSSGRMTVVQGVFIDNATGTAPVVMTVNVTGQRIICPPYSQGFFTLFGVSAGFAVIAQCANAVTQNFWFYNIPIPPAVWNVQSQFSFDSNGYALVSDPAIEALIEASCLRTKTVIDIADVGFVNQAVTSATAQTLINTTAPAGFFLDFVSIRVTPDAAQAVAGFNTWELRSGSSPIFGGKAWLPAASAVPTVPTGDVILLQLSDLGYKDLSGNDLIFDLSTALTAGAFNVTVGAVIYTG